MLILIAAVILGALLFRDRLRLEAPAEMLMDHEVRAWVDGKPVQSFVKE